jgi:hypothetical protein
MLSMTVVFQKTLVRAGEVRSFQIRQRSAEGWEISQETNTGVKQRKPRSDWHRVERDLALFAREIAALRLQGWRDA